MSKAFIAEVIRQSTEVSGVTASRATNELLNAIVKELKKTGKFTLPSFGNPSYG
jgi:DNA-binding protein HU-beta